MKHVDCLFRRGVVSVIKSKSFNNPTRFELGLVNLEKFGNCFGLLGCEQTLPQFDFAKMRLIHLGRCRNCPQRELLCFAHAPQPLPESLRRSSVGCFLLSSHAVARYRTACQTARAFYVPCAIGRYSRAGGLEPM